ncbi:MAG: type I methionyl aminopeptidase [Sciscionella sp.]
MIEFKTRSELEAMRAPGRVVAQTLATVSQHATVGTALLQLDEVAEEVIEKAGAVSSFKGYHPGFAPFPYPAVLCTSVNDAVVHGVPSRYRLADGDLLSIDFAVHLDGWCADAAISLVVGQPRPGDQALIDTTARGLRAGIAAAQVGNTLGDIAHAIGRVGRDAGYGILADHGGHGIGRAMHEQPHVPNEGRAGRGLRLRPGLVLAIEPMFLAGGQDNYRAADDGWTLCTADGSRAAHVEHTVAVTEDGPWVLTVD